jgi:hypothetical protein
MTVRIFKPGGIEALNDVTPEVIAEICRVHVTTARRWKKGEMPPFAALQLLKLFYDGEIGVVDLKWAGWRLRNGLLMSEDGTCFMPGEVRAIPWLRQQIESYQRDQRLPRQSDWVSEKWTEAPEQERAAG